MFNIALNTFKEIVRNKYLYIIILFAIILIVFSVLLGNISFGEQEKIIVDFGLAMIEIFGLIGVLFIGSQLLFNEVNGKTIFLILSKPIKRRDFILGKIFGFSLNIIFIILVQSIFFLIILYLKDIQISKIIILSIINIFLTLEIVLAIVFFLSTFMSNILSIICSFLIYILSKSFFGILDLAYNSGNELYIFLAKILSLLFPPLESLNTKDLIGFFIEFQEFYFLQNFTYGVLYFFILVFISIIIFNKKDFN